MKPLAAVSQSLNIDTEEQQDFTTVASTKGKSNSQIQSRLQKGRPSQSERVNDNGLLLSNQLRMQNKAQDMIEQTQ